jgi:hypothetical protein
MMEGAQKLPILLRNGLQKSCRNPQLPLKINKLPIANGRNKGSTDFLSLSFVIILMKLLFTIACSGSSKWFDEGERQTLS